MASKLIVIVGSGPGIGTATAAKFASHGFDVALLARNQDRLNEARDRISTAASESKIHIFPVDIGNHDSLKVALDKLKHQLGLPEVIHFNAARVAPSEFGNTPSERLSEDFQVMNVGLYVTASWAVPVLESVKKERPDSHPSFFITGGGIWQYPDQEVFALSMQKAAQVNFAGSLSQWAGPKGIHVATVCVNGVVQDSDSVINAKNIATKFWELYSQEKNSWESMVDVGDRTALAK